MQKKKKENQIWIRVNSKDLDPLPVWNQLIEVAFRWKWNSDVQPLTSGVALHASVLLRHMEPTECAALQSVFALLISWPLKQLNLTHITDSTLERS